MMLRLILFVCAFLLTSQIQAQLIRTIDGTGNNILNSQWGAANAELGTMITPAFSDGISSPAGANRPNPRIISNNIFAQDDLINDPLNLSDYVWVFGQFIDHDITAVSNSPVETANIPVDFADEHFNPGNMNDGVMIRMNRSMERTGTGLSVNNPRKFTNDITSWIDASNVYGSDQTRADYLRSFTGGKLKVSAGNLLPYNTDTHEADGANDSEAPHMDNENPFNSLLFVAGDARANEQPLLACFHTLFAREHNRLCDEFAVTYPGWSDEELYQHARRHVGGYLQSIVYNEWLPSIGVYLPAYQGYDHMVYPNITNVFGAAAFRLGHTLLNSNLQLMEDDGTDMGSVTLAQAFFNPAMVAEQGLDRFLKGMAQQVEQDMDGKVVDDVRNFLFGPPQLGMGGLDLASININRGRERGLPDFNTIRTELGLTPYAGFTEICDDQQVTTILAGLYNNDINSIDPWVGMLVESHMTDALFGETVMKIMEYQFQVLRDGDRFHYKNDPILTNAEKTAIDDITFREIIMRNTDLTLMQSNVFRAMPHDSICSTSTPALPLFGSLRTLNGFSIIGAEVALTNSTESILGNQTTDAWGNYNFDNNSTCEGYYVRPTYDGDIREDVNTYDLLLLIRHILAIESFNSPYQHIAADANNNGTVNIVDLIEIKKVILHFDSSFVDNTSWRFIDQDYTFTNPTAPLAENYPDYRFVKLSEYNMDNPFLGIKIGDISGDVNPSNLQSGDSRTDETLVFEVDNQSVKAGETYTIAFDSKTMDQLVGYQYTINFDPAKLVYEEMIPGAIENLDADNFAIHSDKGAITTSWFNVNPVTTKELTNVFNLRFTALVDGSLKEALNISSDLTKAEGYNQQADRLKVALDFRTIEKPSEALILNQNQPNPFAAQTLISFNLPEAGSAVIEFFDVAGRQLLKLENQFDRGYNAVQIDRADLGATGLIYYQLNTAAGSITKKMILK